MERNMNYMLINVEDRQRIMTSFYETYEKAHKAMIEDVLACLDPALYQKDLEENGETYGEDWWIREDCAWISDNAFDYNIEWYIVCSSSKRTGGTEV